MPQDEETARTVDELRSKLRQLGLAGAREAAVIEGFDGTEDAAIMFLTAQGTSANGVGFSTANISIDAAHGVVQELTTLVRMTAQHAGTKQIVTPYFRP